MVKVVTPTKTVIWHEQVSETVRQRLKMSMRLAK